MTAMHDSLADKGWKVLVFAEGDITDGIKECDMIVDAVKEQTKAAKKTAKKKA